MIKIINLNYLKVENKANLIVKNRVDFDFKIHSKLELYLKRLNSNFEDKNREHFSNKNIANSEIVLLILDIDLNILKVVGVIV